MSSGSRCGFSFSYARTVARLHRYYADQAKDPPQADQADLAEGVTEALALGTAIADTWLSVHGRWSRLAVTRTRRDELASMLTTDDH